MKIRLKHSLLLILITGSLFAQAQKNYTANEAADHVQRLRDTARNFYDKPNANKQDIGHGIAILNRAIHFVDSLPIHQMSAGSPYLKGRKSDVTRELVYAYAKNHQDEQAIAALEEHFKLGTSFYIKETLADSVFINLNKNPDFIAVANKYKPRSALWAGDALKTPYQINLSEAEKLAGLSLLWAQARTGFAYFDRLTTDWNQTYLDYISQVEATKSTLEYYHVLQKFYAQLHDGHTNVYFPKEISAEVNSRPPVKTELIEGHIYITAVNNDSLQKAGMIPGLEILRIDGQPVKEYAEINIRPYQSSSTQQDLDVRTYTYSLLSGAASKPVNLELKNKKGEVFSRNLPRSGYPKLKQVPAMEYKEIGAISYLSIHNFEDNRIVKQFDSLYNQIDKTKGMIIDIRDNGGGDSGIGNRILASLTDKEFNLFAFQHVTLDAISGAPGIGEPQWTIDGVATQSPNQKHFYNKPIVLLINAATFSAAEDFAVAFDSMKRGKIIGQPSGGSTGQPLRFNLPGGGSARFCARRETYANGKEFVGIGVQPDIIINKSVSDVYSGTDSVLKKALDMLK